MSVKEEAAIKTVGRGTIVITLAKLYFMVSGYGIYFVLPRLLSSEQFGIYGFVTGIVSIINVVIVTGTQQAVSKFISQDVSSADAVKRLALKLQCVMGGGLTAIYFLAAPLIAQAVNDMALVTPLRISALIPIAYSFYAVYLGYLNGQKKFLRQSAIDISYSTIKVVAIVGLAWFMHNVVGAILGFGIAAAIVFFLAPFIAGNADGQQDTKPTTMAFIKFQVTLFGFMLVNTLLQKTDIILLKKLGDSSVIEASRMVGYYTALMAVANITYQAIISIAFVIFPLISQASFAARREEVRSYIRQTIKYTLILMALSATIFSSNAAGVLGLLYRTEYAIGAPALQIAAYGMLFFGLIYILSTIISGSGRPRVSLWIGIATLMVSAMINAVLIPRYGLVGAATATSLAMALSCVAAIIYIYRTFGACIDYRSLLVVLLAVVIIYQIAIFFPHITILGLMVKMGVQTIVYFTLLVGLGAIKLKDLAQLRKLR